MLSIKNKLDDDEKILYEPKKKKWIIIFGMIMTPLWILISLVFFIPCFKIIFLGEVSFDSLGMYIGSIFALMGFIPLAVMLLISYFINALIITDKRVFIRKGISGCLIIIKNKDIVSYRKVIASNKGGENYIIWFCLKNGEHIKTGNLFTYKNDFMELTELLNSLQFGEVNSKREVKKIKEYYNDYCEVYKYRNFIYPAVTSLPFILALLMIVLLITGYNETGTQYEIDISGTVKDSWVDYDKKNKISGYKISVVESGTNTDYTIPVSENIYIMFKENDNILITAKKGSLGLIYDQWFYKEGE